ncbi:ABC transporter substrate-binding protein [Saccharopolyspora subtropica]|uniref:ABC transporter substrate-binding protein n=1 Tax=Saccharopolyspora thermophila TaxID=89367 RepID=A0A917NGG0_9PSEU|nr:transporter substrate-binding domain-containing protein [Saccharopolyspora subtropica]GGI98681.1 ABC transporter substrate-binding protein [Saccharopolyspora subtropica]
MKKSTKQSLGVLALVIVAVLGGWVGSGFRGGGAADGIEANQWMNKIRQRGELRVGVAIAPPMTDERNGVLGGPNLIPLQDLAEQLGVRLTPVPADWSNIVAGLQADRYDVAANLDQTLQRAVSIQFTDPVYEYQGVFVVASSSPLNSSAAILAAGQPVATAQGSATGAAVRAAGAQLVELAEYTDALQAVQAGRAIAEFTDLPTAVSQVQANPAFKIVVPDPPIYSAYSAYGVPRDIDPQSMRTLNIAINNARANGSLDRAYAEVNYRTIDKLGDLQKK